MRRISDRRDARKAEEHRSPPNNLEAEQALLGALLVNNEAIHLVATFLEAPHFFLPVHGRIHDAVMHFVGRREIANPVTLRAYFENDEALKEAGGAQYLARLVGSAVTVINAGHYGRAVHDLYLRRQLIFYAEDVSDAAFDAPREQVESVEASLEMSAEQLGKRVLSIRTVIEHHLLRTGKVEPPGFDSLFTTARGLEDITQVIDDAGLQAPDYIELSARRLKRRNRLDLLNVDHLQLMRSPRGLRPQNRLQQITEITMRTKALAKVLHVPVLLLPQLNRAGKRADSKVLQLSDLRDSGSIEQDTDSILFLYRNAYYLVKNEPYISDREAHAE